MDAPDPPLEQAVVRETLRTQLTVLIPCYNAGSRVLDVVQRTLPHVQRVIVVDDGCTDGCIDALRALPVEILPMSRNCGKGHALIAGFRRALEHPDTLAIAVIDADGQHNPAELPGLWDAFQREQPSLLIGARQFTGGHVPLRSRFGNILTARLTRLLLGARLPDTQCGYRILARPFAEEVVRSVPGGRYETEMEIIVKAIRGPWRIASAPIATLYETGNASSHFHKVRDSFLIYSRLLRAAVKRCH